jgi:hypothetical protein
MNDHTRILAYSARGGEAFGRSRGVARHHVHRRSGGGQLPDVAVKLLGPISENMTGR